MIRSHSRAAGVFDFLHDGVSDTGVFAVSVHAAAQVVDDDQRAPLRQLQAVQAAQAPAASGDDRGLLLEVDHRGNPLVYASTARIAAAVKETKICLCRPR